MSPETKIPDPRHLDADQCVDLVNGFLAPDTRLDHLTHVSRCADCEALLRKIAATHERGRARAAEVLAAAPAFVPAPGRRQLSQSLRQNLWLAAAAVMIVVGGAWFVAGRSPLTRSSGQPGFVPLPFVDESRLAVVRDGSENDTLVLLGIAAYQRQDFETAQHQLASPQAGDAMELVRRIYLASAQLQCGRADSALATLERVRPERLPEPWRSESEWTRMVALSRTGRHASADSLLDLLTQGVGPVQDRARRLRAGNRTNP